MDYTKSKIITKCSFLVLLALVSIGAVACGGAGQQGGGEGEEVQFTRPVEVVVPFGPGGGADQVSRLAASAMSKELGVDMPVVNTPGGTGSTGMTSMLSKAPGDSMAALIQDSLSTVAYGSAAFKVNEIQAVCRLQEMPSGLFVQGDGPYDSWDDLVKAAKENPGELKVATVGEGGVDDVMLASLEETQGVEFRAVPFAEPPERFAALLGGEVDVLYEQFGDVRSNLEAGDFEGVLAFSEEPIEGLDQPPIKNEPTLSSELDGDVPVLDQFRGLVVSADTEAAKVEAMSKACAAVSEDSKFKESQEMNFSNERSYQDAEEFQSYLKDQLNTISDLQEKYGLK